MGECRGTGGLDSRGLGKSSDSGSGAYPFLGDEDLERGLESESLVYQPSAILLTGVLEPVSWSGISAYEARFEVP